MSAFTIYHNPRCSKSRAALALLEERGVQPDVVLYLDDPPDAGELRVLLNKLGMSAAQLLRRGEAAWKSSGLGTNAAEADLIAAMVAHPQLIERPIVVCGEHAVVGRPPETVLALLDA